MVNWLALSLGSLPALAWLIFFLFEDKKRPEPKGLILSTFVIGIISAFVALQFQIQLNDLLKSLEVKQLSLISIFLMAGTEELIKFLLVYWWIRERKSFDEPIDAMIYMIVAALGFATLENVASVGRSSAGIELMTLRFVGATLLHSLSSGLIGFYWAKAMVTGQKLFWPIVQGVALATLVHTVFNVLILKHGPIWEATLFLAFVGFFILNDFEKLKLIKNNNSHLSNTKLLS